MQRSIFWLFAYVCTLCLTFLATAYFYINKGLWLASMIALALGVLICYRLSAKFVKVSRKELGTGSPSFGAIDRPHRDPHF